jgi:hypothetical protein
VEGDRETAVDNDSMLATTAARAAGPSTFFSMACCYDGEMKDSPLHEILGEIREVLVWVHTENSHTAWPNIDRLI